LGQSYRQICINIHTWRFSYFCDNWRKTEFLAITKIFKIAQQVCKTAENVGLFNFVSSSILTTVIAITPIVIGAVRYLSIHIMSAENFACSLANAKKSFYRAFNAVFRKVAGAALEEMTVVLA